MAWRKQRIGWEKWGRSNKKNIVVKCFKTVLNSQRRSNKLGMGGEYEALHDCFLTNEVSPSWGWHQADGGEALPQLARIEGEYGFRRPLGLRVGEMGIQPAWGRPKFPVKGNYGHWGVCPSTVQ